MADNKQYINQEQDQGNVLISEDVIAKVVEQAIKDVEYNTDAGAVSDDKVVELVGRRNKSKGLKISINDDNEVTMDCKINVAFGQNVVSIARSVQAAVMNALESIAGVTVVAVNVNVSGIIRQ